MEDTTLKQSTMVSRLPKFGSRATPAAVSNGSTQTISPGWGKGIPVGKQNGIMKVPAPSLMKGRKDCEERVPDSGEETQVVLHSQHQSRSAPVVKKIRKPLAASVGKTQRSMSTIQSTIPRTVTQPSKINSRNSAPKQLSSFQPLCSKVGANAVATGQGSSSSLQEGLQSNLSHSSDSIKSISVENVARSQSFSYLKRPAAALNPPLTRSFSFNRATELVKELPRSLAQSPVARSPVTQGSMVLDHGAKPTTSVCTSSSIPPSTLKKSLLPNCIDGKPSSLSYKLMRPSLIKQPRQVMPVKIQGKTDFTVRDEEPQDKDTPISKPSRSIHSTETTPEDPFSTSEAIEGRRHCLELLEDMSLSSTSSLERNDVSEEYIDDFDDLGNGGGVLLLSVHEGGNDEMGLFKEDDGLAGLCQEGSSVASFVSERVDWAKMSLTGRRDVTTGSRLCGTQALCTERDLPHGSSLELSPSDSSGGTYMWDEEVLEPIGRATQLCGSFDSNLNSMDILNNLDNLDSCDLDEDDLMLDVDLPEDVSLHSDVDITPSYDHAESNYWPWRKRQQCGGKREQIHFEEEDEALQPFDNGLALGLSSSESGHSSLDELMLKHMAQDCTSVREQLFNLRTLLQMEEDGSIDETELSVSSPPSEDPSYQQVEELLKEVQKLREELRGKDILISKLTQQLSAPVVVTTCLCQQRGLQRQPLQDKSTQTQWKSLAPQTLQPSRRSARDNSKLARPSHQALSEALNDHADSQPGDGSVKIQSRTVLLPVSVNRHATLPFSVPTTAPAVSSTADSLSSSIMNSDHHLLNNHLHVDDSPDPRAHCDKNVQLRKRHQQPSNLCLLPRDRKTPVLMKHQGGEQVGLGRGAQGTISTHLGIKGPTRTRHLPPPSRGLPCISSASQSGLTSSALSSSTRTSFVPKEEVNSVRPPDQSNSYNSRLPKPKIY